MVTHLRCCNFSLVGGEGGGTESGDSSVVDLIHLTAIGLCGDLIPSRAGYLGVPSTVLYGVGRFG